MGKEPCGDTSADETTFAPIDDVLALLEQLRDDMPEWFADTAPTSEAGVGD